jgi:hypothetical protein
MYIINEIQTTGNQSALLPALTYADRNEAESAYHMKLGSAAISSVPVHTVVMFDEHGNLLKREFYEHAAEA